ncbi:N-methyl-L-tryptophan oxidase [Georgenia alba]|uniref:N-methyl-L-tryptophan oxidase n=1 Tax=Georgenia alba TaxID=2233858 RepID=A0ABW2Q5A0_9MICO
MDTDVAVVGLGSVGAMVSWHLARRGVRVVGLEQFGLGHDHGAFTGESRLFRTGYHESPAYVPMLLAAREQWLDLEQRSSRTLFHPTGVLSIGLPGTPQMRNVLESLEQNDLPHEVLDAPALRERYPQHGCLTEEVGVLDRLGGVLRPESAVTETLRQAGDAGAVLLDREEVVEIEPTERGVRLRTTRTTVSARHAVVASGVWSGRLVPRLGTALTIKPLVLTWFAPAAPRDFAPERFPGFIRDLDGVHLFGVPSLDGALVKSGWADNWGSVDAPEQLGRFLSPQELEAVGSDVHRLLPDLPPQPSRHSVHMDVFTPDRRGVVGRVGPGVTVATGFSGHGFKLAPVFGEIAADLATGQRPRYDVEMFDPRRFDA